MLRTPVGEIDDAGIQQVIQDLCEMLRWHPSHYPEHTLFEFLDLVMMQDPKAISLENIAVPRVLDQKLEALRDHGIHPVCRELKNDDTSQLRGELTLFSFLRRHFTDLQTPLKPRRFPTDHERDIKITRLRRENGSL